MKTSGVLRSDCACLVCGSVLGKTHLISLGRCDGSRFHAQLHFIGRIRLTPVKTSKLLISKVIIRPLVSLLLLVGSAIFVVFCRQ